MSHRLSFAFLAALAACSSDPDPMMVTPPPPPIAPPTVPPPPPQPPEVSRFEPDAATTGPRLWLTVELSEDDGVATISVWGSDLGAILGFAGHVRFADDHLAIDTAATNALDPAAAIIATTRPGDFAFGAVDRDRDLTTPAKIAELTARTTPGRRSTLSITRAAVRRTDGTYVPITTTGGTLITAGGAS